MVRKFAILTLLAFAWLATPLAVHAKDRPRPRDGAYNLSVAGAAKGNGYATVGGDSIKLQANIVSDKGEKGELNASNLTLVRNHFTGTGNVLGQQATFKGRLDVPDSVDEKAIRGVRVVCTVAMADGRYLRLVGFLPPPPAATTDSGPTDDDDRDRGKGKGK